MPDVKASSNRGLELQQQLQRLEEMIVMEGMKLPMTNRTVFNDEQLLSQLLTIEKSIPVSITEAEQILEDRDEILNRAHQKAQDIISQAERRAAQIANELTIIKQAETEAQQLRNQVQEEVEKVRRQNFSEIERVRRQTQQEIEAMRRTAQMECSQLHQESDWYADNVLLDLEQNLGGMIKVIQNGRKHLQAKSAAQKAQVDADHPQNPED
ncbi:MAG: ATP synthase F0 subunit B [Cyanobacteria bacterium P01_F01_bin.42]